MMILSNKIGNENLVVINNSFIITIEAENPLVSAFAANYLCYIYIGLYTVCPKSPVTHLRTSTLRSNNIKRMYHGIICFTYIDALLLHSIVSKIYLKISIFYPFINFRSLFGIK